MTENNEYLGPLAGLNVIDFGHYYAGPMVGMLLADQGANVIRIIRPGEPELPSQQYRLLNRNKKLLTLDLKTEKGKAQALSLIERADIVVENFRPGVMKRLGLDYVSIKDKNSRLIYLSLPGFASTDKERSYIQAWEGVLGAACGLFTDLSVVRPLLGYPPVYSWVPLCSTYGASHGAIAAMAALHAREEHGNGTVIEIPLVEAGISAFGGSFLNAWKPDGFAPFRTVDAQGIQHSYEEWVAQSENRFSSDDSPAVRLEKLASAFRAFYSGPGGRFYRCRDGRQVLIWGAYGSKYGIGLFKGLGIYEQLLEKGFVAGDSRKGNSLIGILSPEWQQLLVEQIEEAFLTKSAEEWEKLLGEISIIAKLRTRSEWLAMKPMLDSGLNVIMDDGCAALTVPGHFSNISGPAGVPITDYREAESVTMPEADALIGPKPAKSVVPVVQAPLKKGDLLQHLKVLDLSNIVAGPTSAYTLAQYGAEVIKLDPQNMTLGTYAPIMTLEIGQGKRSILVDIKTAPGREIFERLVSWADVVLHNFLDDVAERLGVTQQRLQTINPKIVSCQISCFGGAKRGGWELHPGYDPIPQTATGLMAQFGSLEEPQMHGRTACGDNMGAIGLAFTALLATWQQRKTGVAGEGRTSMAQSNNFVQLPYMIAENGKSDWGEAHGQLALGDHWYQRLYECRDGWIYVAATEAFTGVLTECVTGKCVADIQAAEGNVLEDAFVERDCADWLNLLDEAGIACHRVLSVTDIVNQGVRRVSNKQADEVSLTTGEIFCWEDHPCGFPILIKAPDWVLVGEERTFKRLTPTPIFGQNSQEILQEIGYSNKEIEKLIHLKVVHEYQPVMGGKNVYLPPDLQK